MDQPVLPFDIQYRILAEFSELDLPDNTQANWGQILNLFCVSRLWYSSLQDLLILHNPAYSLLRTSRNIGDLAVMRLIADYQASEEKCNNTGQQTTTQPVQLRPRTYSAKQDLDHHEDRHLRDDLDVCTELLLIAGLLTQSSIIERPLQTFHLTTEQA